MKQIILTFSFLLLFAGFGSNIFAQKSINVDPFARPRVLKTLYGDGKHDDTKALNAWGRGERVLYKGRILNNLLTKGKFLITWEVNFDRKGSVVRNNTFVVRYTGYDSIYIVHFGRGVVHKGNNITYESLEDTSLLRERTYKLIIDDYAWQIRTQKQLIEEHERIETLLQEQNKRDNQRKSLLKYVRIF